MYMDTPQLLNRDLIYYTYILKCILTNQMTLFEGYNVFLLTQRYLCCTKADQHTVDSNLL